MNEYPDNSTLGDKGHTAGKALLSAVPVIGGSLTVLFETVFEAPIDRRKTAWLKRLAGTVDELCASVEGLTPEKLAEDEVFVSAYLQASNIAVRTHYEEKLRVLNNAVKNVVERTDVPETKKLIFIKLIDEMTPLHLKVLHFLVSTNQYVTELNARQPQGNTVMWGSVAEIWDNLIGEPKSDDPLVDLVISDLHRNGLIFVSEFYRAGQNSSGTGIGREFIEFIELEADFTS